MKNQIKKSNGQLSSYGFHCGYQETETRGENNKSIYYNNGVYIVSYRINCEINNYFLNTLEHARDQYNSIVL